MIRPTPDQLKYFRKLVLGKRQGDMAKLFDVARTTYANWENPNGTVHMPDIYLRKLYDMGYSDSQDYSIESPSANIVRETNALYDRYPIGSTVLLPRWQGVLCGDSGECHFIEDDSEMEVPAFLLNAPAEEFVVVQAAGSSMSTRIEHSEHALVRMNISPPIKSLVVATRSDGCHFLKGLLPGRFPMPYELHSINEAYPPIIEVENWSFVGFVSAILKTPEPGVPNIEWQGGSPLRF